MPSMEDVHADPTIAFVKISSPISQDPVLHNLLTQPTATNEVEGKANAAQGSAYVCPAVLTCVYQCPNVEEGVVRGGKVGCWVCYWCSKWFAGRHPTRVLCHVLKIKIRKDIAACTAKIDPDLTKRYVCCCII